MTYIGILEKHRVVGKQKEPWNIGDTVTFKPAGETKFQRERVAKAYGRKLCLYAMTHVKSRKRPYKIYVNSDKTFKAI